MKRSHKSRDLLCCQCGGITTADPCARCGESPVLVSRYKLREVLGSGAEGTTYRAQEVGKYPFMAIKEMPLRRARDKKARELLRREARVLRQLCHEAVPAYVDDFYAGTGKGRAYYLVQEFIDGRTLADEMEEHRYTLAEVLAILEQLLDILVYLHGLSPPVIHRDIKPTNVMRRPDGRLVLIDFGSVRDKLMDLEMGGATVTGTFGYMAPEQMAGEASEASDLYGLGALGVRLLSRREPHELLRHDRNMDWEPYVQVPKRVRRLLRSLLEPDPRKRARDASEVLEDVRGLRRKVSVEDADTAVAATGRKSKRKNLVEATGAGVVKPAVEGLPRTLPVLAGLAILAGVSAAVTYLQFRADDGDAGEVPVQETDYPPPLAPASPPANDRDTARDGVSLGSYPPRGGEVDAPVQIIVFADFACLYSKRLAGNLIRLDREYGEQVSIHFRDFPLELHLYAYGAHEAARCAWEQKRFWAMHDALFNHQDALARENLAVYAREAGLDVTAFESCLSSLDTQVYIDGDREAARTLQVIATPSYFVNGEPYRGATSYESLEQTVLDELATLEDETR